MKIFNLIMLSAFLGLLCISEVEAVSPTMVADIRANGDSFPSNITVFDNELYFGADDGLHGKELWKWNGSFVSQVGDLIPGIESSDPQDFITYDGSLYFLGLDDLGRDLWRWDGVVAEKISDREVVNLYTHGHGPKVAVAQDTLYFAGRDSIGTLQIWKWDGKQVINLPQGNDSENLFLTNFGSYQDHLLFRAVVNGDSGSHLWRLNKSGTERLFQEIGIEALFDSPAFLFSTSSHLYFHATDEQRGNELWIWDGETTPQVVDIRTGSAGSYPSLFVEYRGEIYFTAISDEHGRELWKWDGGEASLVADIVPGANSSAPRALTVVNDLLYFAATTPDFGRELWSWDGNEASLVADINPGKKDGVNGVLINYNDSLVFAASDGIHGNELWSIPSVPEPASGVLFAAFSLALLLNRSRNVAEGNARVSAF